MTTKYEPDDDLHGRGEELPSSGTPIELQPEASKASDAPMASNPFAETCKAVSLDWLTQPPPSKDWILRRPAMSKDDGDGNKETAGYLEAGMVGMLVAGGGVGKSMALVQLALSVATDTPWLGHYSVAKGGKVLLAMGEEPEHEVRRRIFHAAELMWPNAQERDNAFRNIAENVFVMPLAGKPVALVKVDRPTSGVTKTEALDQLRAVIEEHGPFRLIVLDPLSRFAGPDTEIDNAAATRFVTYIEGLAGMNSKPAVMLAHHSNKSGRRLDGFADSSNARGSSALTDGARWVSEMRRNELGETSLEMTKVNGAAWAPTLWLKHERGGTLRAATPSENIARANKATTDSKGKGMKPRAAKPAPVPSTTGGPYVREMT